MMRFLKFVLPLIAVATIDVLFQCGAWEPFASPSSHAGMSISKKRALADAAYAHIDFVTLGSSRPVYGIDHEQLSRIAAESGRIHANLSVAGMHWMSLGVIAHWLHDHHPEIRGGIIALSVQDFLAPGNGAYEFGIAYPFRRINDISAMAEHVEFNWHDPSTYGLYSGLFEYHADVQDLLKSPRERYQNLRYARSLPAQQVLAGNANESKDICSAHVQTLADCATLATHTHDSMLESQCPGIATWAGMRYDMHPVLAGAPLSDQLRQARDVIRGELRSIEWQKPPIVILMPMENIWLREALPDGAHEWALSVLRPLADEGRIRVLDYTDLFNDGATTDCSAFFDFYHNNVSGRDRLMQALTPHLRDDLY